MTETVPRQELMAAQTPQAFHLERLLEAHQKAHDDRFAATDDAMLIERLGVKVRVVEGDYETLKITTPDDYVTLEGLLGRGR